MRKLLILLPLLVSACSTVPEIPDGPMKPLNTPSKIERLLHDQNDLMVVGSDRNNPEVRKALLVRPMDPEDYTTIPGGQLLERKISVTYPGGSWKLVMDEDQKNHFNLLVAAAERVQVTGYTDGRYNNAVNEKMAMKRAQAGVNLLIDAGFPSPQIASNYMASEGHVGDNTTRAGRAKNRRTTFEFFVDDWENK